MTEITRSFSGRARPTHRLPESGEDHRARRPERRSESSLRRSYGPQEPVASLRVESQRAGSLAAGQVADRLFALVGVYLLLVRHLFSRSLQPLT